MRRPLRIVVMLCLVLAVTTLRAARAADTAGYESARLKMLWERYDVKNWPGKSGPVLDGCRVDEASLPPGLRIERVGVPDPQLDKQTDHVSVSRWYIVARADGTGKMFVDVFVFQIPGEAHEALFFGITATSMMQPPLMPRGSEIGLDLGDICFAHRDRTGFIGNIHWVRNNVYANVKVSSEDSRPYVEGVARAIDAAMSRRATCPTYRQCPSRPVITKVERVDDPEERQRLGLKTLFRVVEVKSAPGDKLYYYSSYQLFNPAWPGEFPFVVSDSNLIGFPMSGIARWKTDGPCPDQMNAKSDAFLRTWEPQLNEVEESADE